MPVLETWVSSLIHEEPSCLEAAKPWHHKCGACALEPGSQNC